MSAQPSRRDDSDDSGRARAFTRTGGDAPYPEYPVASAVGHIARHAPINSAQGRDAAIMDIGQDLLRSLADRGVLDLPSTRNLRTSSGRGHVGQKQASRALTTARDLPRDVSGIHPGTSRTLVTAKSDTVAPTGPLPEAAAQVA